MFHNEAKVLSLLCFIVMTVRGLRKLILPAVGNAGVYIEVIFSICNPIFGGTHGYTNLDLDTILNKSVLHIG